VREGGKSLSRRQRQGETLEHEKAVGQHDQSQVSMESMEASPLVVIEAAFLFGIFVKLFDDPTRVCQQNQALERGLFGKHAEPVFDLCFFLLLQRSPGGLRGSLPSFWHLPFGQQPAFWSGGDTTVAGTVQGGASSPMDAQSHRLDLHGAFRALSPVDGLPGRGGQRLEQLFDRVQGSRARLARLTAPTIDRHLSGSRLNLIWQTAAKGALHGTHIGNLASIEPLRDRSDCLHSLHRPRLPGSARPIAARDPATPKQSLVSFAG
jgi:hypothetical protein